MSFYVVSVIPFQFGKILLYVCVYTYEVFAYRLVCMFYIFLQYFKYVSFFLTALSSFFFFLPEDSAAGFMEVLMYMVSLFLLLISKLSLRI